MTRFENSLSRTATTMSNVHVYKSTVIELRQANQGVQVLRSSGLPARDSLEAPISRKTKPFDAEMDQILNAREGLDTRPKATPLPSSEGAQISKLFKRVRVFVKDNPLPFSEQCDEATRNDRRDSFPVADPLLLVRKRRSSDMDDLADKFNDKCRCVEDD